MKLLGIIAAMFASSTVFAASTHECGSLDSIANLIGQTKNIGNVRVAYVSTEEPAASPDHLLVFISDDQMGLSCTAISNTKDGGGFGYVNMSTLKSIGYDSKKGRLLQVEVNLPDVTGDHPENTTRVIKFRTNTLTHKVTLE